jgi:hypothetical protein
MLTQTQFSTLFDDFNVAVFDSVCSFRDDLSEAAECKYLQGGVIIAFEVFHQHGYDDIDDIRL